MIQLSERSFMSAHIFYSSFHLHRPNIYSPKSAISKTWNADNSSELHLIFQELHGNIFHGILVLLVRTVFHVCGPNRMAGAKRFTTFRDMSPATKLCVIEAGRTAWSCVLEMSADRPVARACLKGHFRSPSNERCPPRSCTEAAFCLSLSLQVWGCQHLLASIESELLIFTHFSFC